MKFLTMALCFLDEEDNVVAKEPFEVTWKARTEIESEVEKTIIIDSISGIIINEVNANIEEAVIKLVTQVWKEES